jgi:hypothetical protein
MSRDDIVVNNSFYLPPDENKFLIYLFHASAIIEILGFGPIENVLLYDKTYFLNKNNFIWHKSSLTYTIEFIIK